MPILRLGSSIARIGGGIGFKASQETGSLAFPGGTTQSTDGRIVLSRLNTNAVDIGNTDFTIEMWIRPTAVSTGINDQTTPTDTTGSVNPGYVTNATDGNIIVDGDGFNTGRGFICGLDNGRAYIGISNGTNGATRIGTTDLRDGAWHHVAWQRTNSDGTLEVLVDGAEERSASGPTGDIRHASASASPATDGQIVFGVEKLNSGWGYTGDIAMIRISTVRRYTGTTYTVPTSAFTDDADTVWLAYLDENSGTTVNDSSGSGINGSLSGTSGPTWSTADPFGGS